jgi:hypothetical protein
MKFLRRDVKALHVFLLLQANGAPIGRIRNLRCSLAENDVKVAGLKAMFDMYASGLATYPHDIVFPNIMIGLSLLRN